MGGNWWRRSPGGAASGALQAACVPVHRLGGRRVQQALGLPLVHAVLKGRILCHLFKTLAPLLVALGKLGALFLRGRALTALGLKQIDLCVDACAECPWSSLRPQIEAQVAETQQLLAPWGKAEVLSLRSTLENPQARPLWRAEDPPPTAGWTWNRAPRGARPKAGRSPGR